MNNTETLVDMYESVLRLDKDALKDFVNYILYEIENTKAQLNYYRDDAEDRIQAAVFRLTQLEKNIRRGYYE